MLRKVHVYERNYSEWKWFDGFTLENVTCELNPLELKLFTEDIIEIVDGNPTLLHSSVRQMKYMPGILRLRKEPAGVYNFKPLYECSPDDKRYPIFLMTFESNEGNEGNESMIGLDIYITFSFTPFNISNAD